MSSSSNKDNSMIAMGIALGSIAITSLVVGTAALVMSARRQPQPQAQVITVQQPKRETEQKSEPSRPSMDRTETVNPADVMDLRKSGITMKEARDHALGQAKRQEEITPEIALQELLEGNTRFWLGKPQAQKMSALARRSLVLAQYPQAAILGCADSRVPIEIVFDQSVGDLFVIRVAGNYLDRSTTASLEYAVHHLAVKVLVIMGHEGCGAIKAARLPLEAINKEPQALKEVLHKLREGLDDEGLKKIKDARARDREAVVANVKYQVEKLAEDKTILKRVQDGKLIIVGAYYEISSGIVDFCYEIGQKGVTEFNSVGFENVVDTKE